MKTTKIYCVLFAVLSALWTDGFADCPQWWLDWSVVNTNASVVANDYAAVNQGQLKWFARNAMLEMNKNLPEGAGSNVVSLVNSFSNANNYKPVNIGQLKYVASLFYDRLIRAGVTNAYPWSAATADDADYAIANLGQLKNVFNFTVPNFFSGIDSDADGMTDAWEVYYFGDLSHTANEDDDHDGLCNLEEFRYRASPLAADTDGDGLNDVVETRFRSRVVCWGDNTYGVTNVPLGLDDVVAIAAGEMHCVALRNNGCVVCWGDNIYNQSTIPDDLTNVVAIAAGYRHSLALRKDGRVVCWGDNSNNQSTIPAGLSNVVAIAAGGDSSMALKSDGRVVCWGDNIYNQLTIPAGLSNVVAITVGVGPCMALKKDQSVVSWGSENSYEGATGMVAIAAADFYCLGLRKNGCVAGWGFMSYYTPIPSGLGNVVAIAAGGNKDNCLALKADGSVVRWEQGNTEGEVPTGLTGVAAISCNGSIFNDSYCMALIPSVRLNPQSLDTDGDGLPDKWEVDHGYNPADNSDGMADPDHDGLTNGQEYGFGTSFYSGDTDGDGIGDYEEIMFLHTNPLIKDSLDDSDGDSVLDMLESMLGTDPNDSADPPQSDITLTVIYPISGTTLE